MFIPPEKYGTTASDFHQSEPCKTWFFLLEKCMEIGGFEAAAMVSFDQGMLGAASVGDVSCGESCRDNLGPRTTTDIFDFWCRLFNV